MRCRPVRGQSRADQPEFTVPPAGDHVTSARMMVQLGGECIKDEAGNPIKCARGFEGYLDASDHLAVLVQFQVSERE
jgi:hypothetical protein